VLDVKLRMKKMELVGFGGFRPVVRYLFGFAVFVVW
jgi:hypothetical protein